jgi:hypothetical protein
MRRVRDLGRRSLAALRAWLGAAGRTAVSRALSLGHFELFGESLKTNDEMKNFARKAGFAFTRSLD